MALSGAKKKARRDERKKKGGAFGGGRRRDRIKTPHHLPGPKARGVARMLVRNHVNELVRIDIEDWRRAEYGRTEIFKATAVFRDGQTVTRTAERRYGLDEREKIILAEFSDDPHERNKTVRAADAIRRFRWSEKQRILGELQREFGKGLPA